MERLVLEKYFYLSFTPRVPWTREACYACNIAPVYQGMETLLFEIIRNACAIVFKVLPQHGQPCYRKCILAFSYLVNGAFVFGQLCVCLLLVSLATLPFLSLHVQVAKVAAAAPWSMVLTCSRTSSSYPASFHPPPPGLKFFLFLFL